jgi:hypothetical protein
MKLDNYILRFCFMKDKNVTNALNHNFKSQE